MNQTAKCHKIEGCNGLYIDAFRAFKEELGNSKSTFILTHYHSDHYHGLPRGKAYNGQALIHCTFMEAFDRTKCNPMCILDYWKVLGSYDYSAYQFF